jgi:hypothetical protein
MNACSLVLSGVGGLKVWKWRCLLATNATINHLNDNKSKIHFPAYEDYAKSGYTLAQELTTLISDYVEYGEHEAEFHRLQDKLQPSAS